MITENNTLQKDIVLKLKDLYKSFGDNHVLNGFNLELYQGENLVIMGKSGSGKSVMIKCLVGLMEADRGTITVMQKDITKLNREALDILRADIGFLFQGSALYDSMSVRENLEFPLRRHAKKINENSNTEQLVIEALKSVGLVDAIDLMPSELSGGMKRRVALARTLILKPKIILYDEPTSGLDPITAKEIIILMQNIQKKYNTSSLIITHDVDCARVISDRMILLIDGIDYAVGTYKELSASDDPKVKAFFKQKKMKKTTTQKIRLGIFVIISTLLFILAVYLIGQGRDMFRKTYTISAYFQNVNGLQNGNNVRYSGIDIGTVKAIKMINDSTIKIDMNIDEKIIKHIKKNAIATIGSDGLVGNMIVNIVPGKGNADIISNGDTIASFSKIGADDILSTLSVGSENAAILTADLLKITSGILEGEGTIGLLLNDTLMAQDLKQSVYNLKKASQGASYTIKELNTIVSSLRTDDDSVIGMILNDSTSGKKLKTIVTNLETSSNEINTILSSINRTVENLNSSEGAYNYIVRDTALVNSLKSTLKNINEGTEKFNQNMEALKHNFLTRGYFRKLERQEKRAQKAKQEEL